MNENQEMRRARTRVLCALLKTGITLEQATAAMQGLGEALSSFSRGIKKCLEYHEIRNEEDLERAILKQQASDSDA